MTAILVVDDDGHIREVVRFALERAGFSVHEAADGASAREALSTDSYALVVLDIVLPDTDGLTLCREIRARGALPILFLSSRDDEIDRVLGLELGGDDYVTKPFSPRELVARVRAVLRRTEASATPAVAHTEQDPGKRWGPLLVDEDRFRVWWRSKEIQLTATEMQLLLALLGAPGRVYRRSELVDRAWGYDHHITDRTVDSHIRRMRAKFAEHGADPIETVYGVGYRLREPAPAGET